MIKRKRTHILCPLSEHIQTYTTFESGTLTQVFDIFIMIHRLYLYTALQQISWSNFDLT